MEDRRNGSLMSNGRFVRLWAGQSVSFVGDAISLVALIVLVVDLTGNAASVGGVLVAKLLPTLSSPLIGVLADRLRERRWLLVAVDIARAIVLLGIVFTANIYVLYGLAFLLGVCQTLFNPMIRASFPGVVGDGDLTRANALISGSFSLSIALGPAIGGLLVALVGVDTAFIIDAATFLVSAAFLAFVPMPGSRDDDGEEGFAAELRAGFSYLASRSARIPLGLVIGAFLLLLSENASVPAEIFLARIFGTGDVGYGLLVSVYGVGMITGSALMAVLGDRANLLYTYFASIAVAGVSLAVTGLAPIFIIALAGFAVAGICNGTDNVATDTLLQKRVPDHFLGRVYSVAFLGRSGGEVIALAAGGFLVDAVGAQPTFLISAASLLIFGVIIFVVMSSTPKRAVEGT